MKKLRAYNMETYQELKNRQQKEHNGFTGIFFAFDNKQFEEGMSRIGLGMDDLKQIVSIGYGGYMREDRFEDYMAMINRHKAEKTARKKEESFLIESLVYELKNHEYCYTNDPTDALDALGYEDIDQELINKACKLAWKGVDA